MKIKTTQKYIKAITDNCIFSVPYCNAQYLLKGLDAFAYNSGVYGWNCDYYWVDGFCVCTGYRTHGKKVNYTITEHFNKLAEEIYRDWTIPYEKQCGLIASLRSEWITRVYEGLK